MSLPRPYVKQSLSQCITATRATEGGSVGFSGRVPMFFDLFWFLLVNVDECIACAIICPKELIELCMNRLRVTMLGALDEERHAPRRKGGHSVQIQGFWLE